MGEKTYLMLSRAGTDTTVVYRTRIYARWSITTAVVVS